MSNSSDRSFPIGIFDSGIGGLTVLHEIRRLLPDEDTIYLGDTARVPYGNKSEETVARYSVENAGFLVNMGIKLLVIACNTASAYSVELLRERFRIPVLGVIEPGAKKAVETTITGRIGVIGTEGTIRSRAYPEAIKGRNSGLSVVSRACPLFVSLAEEGWTDNDVAELTASRYLAPFDHDKIDTLVLGCTHYPLLKGVISKVIGGSTVLVDSAEETAVGVVNMLRRKSLLMPDTVGRPSSHSFFVTDSPDRFKDVGERFMGQEISHVEYVCPGDL